MGPSLSCDRMGKAKKQLTNERRAKRLGTGEGIAPTKAKGGGGMPGWAFMVSGAVLLAAVIIAAAFVVTRSGSSANAQSSSVIQDRLTHSKIDFVAEGTWPPNYNNLDAALTMSLTERQERHGRLLESVRSNDIQAWRRRCLAALEGGATA